MEHMDIKEVFSDSSLIGKEVVVCGWVRTARDSKNVAFMEINDGTSLKHIQIVIDKNAGVEYEQAMKLGCSVKVTGTVAEARQGSVEINAKEITLIGECPADYPLQKKRHTLEFLRTMPQLRARNQHVQCSFPCPLRFGKCYSHLFPEQKFCLCKHSSDHRQRL